MTDNENSPLAVIRADNCDPYGYPPIRATHAERMA
jgi:hypothetical protein